MECEPFFQRHFAIFVLIHIRQAEFFEFKQLFTKFWGLKLFRHDAVQTFLPFLERDESVLVQVEKFEPAYNKSSSQMVAPIRRYDWKEKGSNTCFGKLPRLGLAVLSTGPFLTIYPLP
jgi:hypothetical protein